MSDFQIIASIFGYLVMSRALLIFITTDHNGENHLAENLPFFLYPIMGEVALVALLFAGALDGCIKLSADIKRIFK